MSKKIKNTNRCRQWEAILSNNHNLLESLQVELPLSTFLKKKNCKKETIQKNQKTMEFLQSHYQKNQRTKALLEKKKWKDMEMKLTLIELLNGILTIFQKIKIKGNENRKKIHVQTHSVGFLGHQKRTSSSSSPPFSLSLPPRTIRLRVCMYVGNVHSGVFVSSVKIDSFFFSLPASHFLKIKLLILK